MKEAEIWRDCYDIAMRETDKSDSLFTRDLLQCLANHVTKSIDEKRVKAIFVDCFNLLQNNLEKQNWIAINEVNEQLINHKYATNVDEQMFCAELVAVVVNHLDRKGNKNGYKTV